MFIIIIIIFSFVVFFSPTASLQPGSSSGPQYGSINGQKISRTEYVNALTEAQLRYFFTYGEWPGRARQRAAFDEMRETYQRLFVVRKLAEHNIQVDDASVAQAARNILSQFSREQPITLDIFVNQVLGGNATVQDFERFLRHDLGIQQLIAVIGASGKLVPPDEVRALYQRRHEEVVTEAVFFAGTNYLAEVSTENPEAIGQFYTNQMAYYRLPDRVQVSYVRFDATNFAVEAEQEMAKITNVNAIVEQVYAQRGTNFYAAQSLEEAKEKIRVELRGELELGAARKKANEFASELFNQEPQHSENLAALAQQKGIEAHISQPFDEENGPTEFDGGPNFGRLAFSLSPTNDPFAGPIIGDKSVYVIAYHKQIPSDIPPFETIRDRVTADYKRVQAAMLARQAGAQFAQTLTNQLAQGKSFAAICAEANVQPVSIPPLSLSTRELPAVEDHISLNQYKQIAFSTEPGKASPFNPTMAGGVVVYVKQRNPADAAKMNAELPEFTRQVQQQREQEVFGEWFRREAETGLRDTPLLRAQQEPAGPPQ